MKKITNYFIIFFLLFSICSYVHAEEFKYGYISSDNGVNIRTGPGTNHPIDSTGLKEGTQIKILSKHDTDDPSNSCKVWYKIVYLKSATKVGYVCSDFVKLIEIQTNEDFEKTLLTFPKSYHEGLRFIHTIYPNAIFKPYDTRLDFNTVINNESTLGKSLIWDAYPNNHRNGLKHLDSYNIDSNTFNNHFPGGGNNWYAASNEIIAYYLDPRNFFDESHIFMFESLSFIPSVHSVDGVNSILKGSFMEKEHPDKGPKTFADVIMDAGMINSMSPYYLASRILQETGYTRSALVQGVYPNYPKYNGYYNFYNYGAGGNNVVENGLKEAYKRGWNSEEKAIVGGASLIGSSYIKEGQDTNYFQKWDVVCAKKDINACSFYSHQYMQNIEAPYHEAKSTFNGYKTIFKENVYNIPFIFSIPIYQNMPDKVNMPSEKNPINYLKDIKVNNELLANFSPYNNEYIISLPKGTTTVNINATAVDNKAVISGIGNIKTDKDIEIKVTAENGQINNYKIKIKYIDSDLLTLDQTLNRVRSGLIKGDTLFSLTNVNQIKEEFLKANSLAKIIIKDINGKVTEDGLVGTGYKVIITVGEESKEFNTIIYGDTNGDAKIDILDLLRIQKQILKISNLDGIQIKASDVSKDGIVDILDLLKVQKHILGIALIKQ